MDEATQSTFVIKKDELNDSESYKIILYSTSDENKRADNWQVTIEQGWMSGIALNEDRGAFYRFLIENGLASKIEIIRC